MASVGALGCGFEHQLESVYAALNKTNALSNGNGPNGDFLRADAVLAVVFVTNEDDASADPATRTFTSPRACRDNSVITTPIGKRAGESNARKAARWPARPIR